MDNESAHSFDYERSNKKGNKVHKKNKKQIQTEKFAAALQAESEKFADALQGEVQGVKGSSGKSDPKNDKKQNDESGLSWCNLVEKREEIVIIPGKYQVEQVRFLFCC